MREITHWAIRSDPYASPEMKRLWITGVTPDNGKTIQTNYNRPGCGLKSKTVELHNKKRATP